MSKIKLVLIMCLYCVTLTGCQRGNESVSDSRENEKQYDFYSAQMDYETFLRFNGVMEEKDFDGDGKNDYLIRETLANTQESVYYIKFSEKDNPNMPNEEMQQSTLFRRIIADIPEMDLSLTGRSNGYDYMDISLHYNGQTLPISGTTMAGSMFMPSLVLFENNSKAAIILIESEGSGIYISSIHIVDLEEFHEISHEDAIPYLSQKISSTVDVETGIVNLELPDRILQFDTSDIVSPTNLFDQVGYGSIVKYYIENDKIYCDAALHIAPGSDLGYVRLEYCFTENEYTVDRMEFQEFSDNRFQYCILEK